ncbi:hypothetical protein WR25_20748 [Diploscapter pachys]|uniref:DNA polymerase epsilon subunit n=1 Tax=Diploscapter pachys TaxID=2018661 RepID=A0A2A2JUF2_9BILA|nr:hypothetical protein WR25_20748 [Diploscapter pachys]
MDDENNHEEVRREVQKHFRVNGMELKRDASKLCIEVLSQYDKERRKKWLDKLVELIKKQTLDSSVLDESIIRDVFEQISHHGQQEDYKLFNVFDLFSVKRFYFDANLKKMLPIEKQPEIISNVSAATSARRQRFLLVQQRARRSPHLKNIKLYTVETLASLSKKISNVVVLGMISQQKAGTYHIEDLTGSLQVDFTEETKFHSAIFTEGTIALFEGSFDGGILIVNEVALAPLESAAATRQDFGNATENWFGGDDPIAFRCNPKLRAAEIQNPDAAIVVLSDIHLDDSTTMRNLFELLKGFVGCPPTAFIFCGNFCSKPRQSETWKLLENGFKNIANQIHEVQSGYKQTSFVFVPGPDDPSLNMILPRPNLPAALFEPLDSIDNVYFATNPCRMQYATQEVVVLRDDLIEKMCRHAINHVETDQLPERISRTILSQPIAWQYDSVLGMHPLPDLLIIADRFKAFDYRPKDIDTTVLNPGSFSRTANFYVYYPANRKCESSAIR